LVCDNEYHNEFYHFQEDQGEMPKFPYFKFLLENCCSEGFNSVLEHRQDCSYNSEEEEEYPILEFEKDVSCEYIHKDFYIQKELSDIFSKENFVSNPC